VRSDEQASAGQRSGHALSVECVIDGPAEPIFDAFIAIYDSQRALPDRHGLQTRANATCYGTRRRGPAAGRRARNARGDPIRESE